MNNRLCSWREVITPHQDIRDGNYRNADFMADLGNAVNGTAGSEYTDAVNFFRRTYLTDGLKNLLVKTLKRLCGGNGEPVIQIKTAFGGGKTHSMLALYHLLRGDSAVWGMPELRPVLEESGVYMRPSVRVAVLACTGLTVSDPVEVCGLKVNTLWGNMAAQLGGYEYVRSADVSSVAPGNSALVRMFDECGPCLVLIDELVAYGRKLLKESEAKASGIRLPAGTFGNLLTFIQELTEAAKFSKNALVAATLPESEDEGGSEQGMEILHRMGHIFGRIDSVWKPITASEGFEIVRKRLFLECSNPSERERTADEFMRMYESNKGDFPSEIDGSKYRERIIACYPFHPELFDRLYEDWATLEKFQRTRGVLRLLAGVVCRLWRNGDVNALIMPGSLPLWDFEVREGLVRALPDHDAWNPIVEKDIDGDESKACMIDGKKRFANLSAARRAARTIMLGSAPAGREQALRGIDGAHIRLGSVQPGENIAVYNDAVNELKKELTYLYADDSRLWFDTHPTLKKIAQELADEVKAYDVSEEVTRRLKKLMKKQGAFVGVHVHTKGVDVPDEQGLRLVVLGLDDSRSSASEILSTKYGGQRREYMNMVVFLEADGVQLEGVRRNARSYLAWKKLESERESRNLDARQQREVQRSVMEFDGELDGAIVRAWNCVLSPHSEKGKKVDDITLESLKLKDSGGDVVAEALRTLRSSDRLSDKWGAVHMSTELENLVWDECEDISVKTLWEYVCKYCYMPRVESIEGVYEGISDGVKAGYFALADGKDDGKYTHLRIGEPVSVNDSDFVVRKDIAEEQLAAEKSTASETETAANDNNNAGIISTHGHTPKTQTQTLNRKFYMTAHLERKNNPQDFIKTIFRDIIDNLHDVPGAQVEIVLNVQMKNSDGVPDDIYDAVVYNCKHFGITDCEFYE